MTTEEKARVIIYPGKGDIPKFTKGTKVTFHFKTIKKGENGEEIVIDDSKKANKAMELLIGKEFKMPVLEECIKAMRINEISSFNIHKSMLASYPLVSQAYRKFSAPKCEDHDDIPTRRCCGLQSSKTKYADLNDLIDNPCDLQFIIELLQVENPEDYEKEVWQMEEHERIASIPKLKEEGNKLYNEKKYEEASTKYATAIGIIDQLMSKEKPKDDAWNELDQMKIPFLSNYSQCKLFLGDYYSAIEHSSEVIKRDERNTKAYFRRAKAHAKVWNVQQAKKDFEKVVQLDSTMENTVSKLIKELEINVKEKEKQEAHRLKGKMF